MVGVRWCGRVAVLMLIGITCYITTVYVRIPASIYPCMCTSSNGSTSLQFVHTWLIDSADDDDCDDGGGGDGSDDDDDDDGDD